METADNTALNQRPETLDRVCMNRTNDVLSCLVINNAMENPSRHIWVTFEEGYLWWCTVRAGITVNQDRDSEKTEGSFWLSCNRPWSNRSVGDLRQRPLSPNRRQSSKDSKHPSHVSLMRRASPQSPFRIVQHLVFPSLVFSDGLAATLCSANCDATCPVPVCRTCGWRSYSDVVFVPGASHSFRVKDWILLPSAVHSMQLILSAYTV